MESGSHKNMHDKKPEHDPIKADEKCHPSGSVEVNMEVPIEADAVMRAGGFGATDDIRTILPAAGDSTDFEEHLRDACDEISQRRSAGFPKINFVAGKVEEGQADNTTYDAVKMEAYVTSDDVMRAGGYGATDNISSFLPVASDFTDFEENLRIARAYEESEEKSNRPGLGWRSEAE